MCTCIRYGTRVTSGSHSFTCHPHTYHTGTCLYRTPCTPPEACSPKRSIPVLPHRLAVILRSVRTQPEASRGIRKHQESSGSAGLQVPQHQTHAWHYPTALPLERRRYPAIAVAHFPEDVDSKEVWSLVENKFPLLSSKLSLRLSQQLDLLRQIPDHLC